MIWTGWIALAIIAAASEKCLNRFFLADGTDYWGYLIGYNIGAILFVLGFSGLPSLPHDSSQYPLLGISGFLWLMVCVFTFKADQYAEVSVTSVISRLQLILICLGGMFFFGEKISNLGFVGLLLISFGLILLGFRKKMTSFRANPGVTYKLLSVAVISAVFLIDKGLIQHIDAKTITFFGYATPLLFALISSPKRVLPALRLTRKLKFMNMGLGALSCLSYYGLVQAMKSAPISLVVPLFQLELVLVLIAGYFILNERDGFFKKLAASVVILIGVGLMRI